MASSAVYRLIWIPCGLALIGTVAAFGMSAAPPPQIGQLTPFTTDDKVLAIEYPGNWQPRSNAISGQLSSIHFVPSRNVNFEVRADFAGSLMDDINKSTAGAAGGLGGMDTSSMPGDLGSQMREAEARRKSPLQAAHAQEQLPVAKALEGYAEQDPQDTHVGGLEALASSFTAHAPGVFKSVDLVGKRYTAIANDRRITLVYWCPHEEEEKLGPVFEQMIQSLHIGQGG